MRSHLCSISCSVVKQVLTRITLAYSGRSSGCITFYIAVTLLWFASWNWIVW